MLKEISNKTPWYLAGVTVVVQAQRLVIAMDRQVRQVMVRQVNVECVV